MGNHKLFKNEIILTKEIIIYLTLFLSQNSKLIKLTHKEPRTHLMEK